MEAPAAAARYVAAAARCATVAGRYATAAARCATAAAAKAGLRGAEGLWVERRGAPYPEHTQTSSR